MLNGLTSKLYQSHFMLIKQKYCHYSAIKCITIYSFSYCDLILPQVISICHCHNAVLYTGSPFKQEVAVIHIVPVGAP